jgi:hypothetical protein
MDAVGLLETYTKDCVFEFVPLELVAISVTDFKPDVL